MAADHFLRRLLSSGADDGHGLAVAGRTSALAASVELAVDSASRKRGLLGRSALAPDRALVIAPCSGIHTFGMRFAIDVIFVGREGRVLKIARAVRPGRIALRPGAFAVVEMAAGEADRQGLRVGDTLEVRRT